MTRQAIHAGGVRFHWCQWPDCVHVASRYIRRGGVMAPMYVCDRHARAFHEASDPVAWRVSRERLVPWSSFALGERPVAQRRRAEP